MKLQISLRAKIAEGLILPNADLWFAYTGHSQWQLWNQADSSPFRNTDYQPEAIYVVPISERINILPAGWRWRMVQLGLVHQSNGQTEPLSRSWNRVYLTGGFNHGDFGLTVRAEKRLDDSNDDNPDIVRYVGNSEVVAAWVPGLATALLSWRLDTRNLNRGSVKFDWTYPVTASSRAGCAGMCNCSPATARRCWTTTTAKPASVSGWRCSSSSRMGRAWSCTAT